MSYRISVIILAMTAVCLSASGGLASSHEVGPYTKPQLHRLCAQASGRDTAGPSAWGCEARVWKIGCAHNGKTCIIDLFGNVAAETSAPSRTLWSPPTGAPAPTGGKVTDFGGAAHPTTIGH